MDGSRPRRHLDGGWPAFFLAPDCRHRPLQEPRKTVRDRGLGRGDRHRGGAAGQFVGTARRRCCNITSIRRSIHICLDGRLPHRAGGGANAAAGARGGRLELVKLEVLGPPPTLYPDMRGTFEAAEALIKDGFEVMCDAANVACKRLEDMGCVAIMPLGAPIGSGLGIQNAAMIWMIREQTKVPFLVDAGVGTASDAAIAMELGCDAVLLNSAIAHAKDPIRMAKAMKLAIEAGRQAYLAGRMPLAAGR